MARAITSVPLLSNSGDLKMKIESNHSPLRREDFSKTQTSLTRPTTNLESYMQKKDLPRKASKTRYTSEVKPKEFQNVLAIVRPDSEQEH